MSGPVANCPSCGGPVEFRWAGAVQTVCTYCQSVLVRHDVDLEAVGVKSLPPPVTSPVQLGTRGRYRDRPFEVTGRIAYEYERGGWSEWHLAFGDGSSGWLSDAQAEYAVSFLAPDPGPLPAGGEIRRGQRFTWGGAEYQAAAVTRANYAGVEGELPFEYWDKEQVPFVDLKTADGRFATLDYSEPAPLLYLGEYVDFADLRLTGLREAEAQRVAGTRALNCPNCGAGVEILDPEHALNVVCESCSSVLDAKSPSLAVLQTFKAKQKVKPRIPMGAKGTWKGDEYRVLGFQQRTIRVEGTDYSWREYLLFNPRQGYRYFTEYDGHWNDVIPLKTIPEESRAGGRPVARLHRETFKHFQQAEARTSYVLGEFPWEVRFGDKVTTSDFVAPPRMLSAETTEDETTWSLGEYTTGDRVWKAFGLEGNPPAPKGVYANQPSPHRGKVGAYWKAFGVLMGLWFVFLMGRFVAGGDPLLTESFRYAPGSEDLAVATTPPFELKGRSSALGVDVRTDVSNNWVFFNYALLNQETGRAIEFGREVSYYYGRDGGESWTEGDRSDEVRVPSVPPGRYVLRIEPDGPAPVSYTVKVRNDVPGLGFFLVALLVLALPPVLALLGGAAFETSRWAESDYSSTEDDE
jgi:transcription initiation factor TFIIIB Brf1 subunit/transcription initiation factor TFIIB